MSDKGATDRQADMKGTLSRYPLPRLLFYFAKKRFCGWLDIERPNEKPARTYFRDGVPARVDMVVPEDYLGRVLLEKGWITTDQYDRSLITLAQGEKRHGHILLEMGYIEVAQLIEGLSLQLRRKLNRLFQLKQASFAVYGAEHDVGLEGESAYVRADPLWVIYQGVRNTFKAEDLRPELSKLDGMAISLKASTPGLLERYGIAEEEKAVVEVLQRGSVPLNAFFRMSPLSAIQTEMLVYVLWVTEALDATKAIEGDTANVQAEMHNSAVADPAQVAQSARSVAMASAPDVSALAADMLGTTGPAPRATRPSIVSKPPPKDLDVAPPPHTVSNAPHTTPPPKKSASPSRAATAKSKDNAAVSVPPPLFKSGEKAPIRRIITPPPVDPEVAIKSERKPPSKVPAKQAKAPAVAASTDNIPTEMLREQLREKLVQLDELDHFQVLGLAEDCTTEQVRDAYFKLAKVYHPDRIAGMGLGDLAADADRLFRRINEAHSVLSDEKEREEYLKKRDVSDETKAILRAELVFQSGMASFRKRKYDEALAHFKEACQLSPREGEHIAWVAWTRYCNPKTDTKSILPELRKELQHAIECSPRSAVANYFLGEIYLAMDDEKRAVSQFERTVELKSDHIDALRQLRLIRMRQEKGKKSRRSGLFERFRKN